MIKHIKYFCDIYSIKFTFKFVNSLSEFCRISLILVHIFCVDFFDLGCKLLVVQLLVAKNRRQHYCARLVRIVEEFESDAMVSILCLNFELVDN